MNNYISSEFCIGVKYLKSKDKTFNKIANSLDQVSYAPRSFDYTAFCKIVIGQQLSSKAAITIFNRFLTITEISKITPKKVLELESIQFLEVGISKNKMRYLKNFANLILENPFYFDQLKEASSDNAYKSLVEIDGVGPWTANIIQLFYLGNLDIFPIGDASLEKVYSRLYLTELTAKNKNSYKHINWASPYRGVLAVHLWSFLDSGLFKQLD
jgi:DNA-3-methyladenine glycosylase II